MRSCYRKRHYSPETGRFLSEDPIRFAGGDVNLYKYAYNNALKFNDPYGWWSCPTEGCIRGTDPQGNGAFGSPRSGGRTHAGIDYSGGGGSSVTAPMSGWVEVVDDGIRITRKVEGLNMSYSMRLLHINPTVVHGQYITEGARVGTVQDLTGSMPGITNHAHVELYVVYKGETILEDPSMYLNCP